MKIFLDIGHPAHVHYFRNFIEVMKKRGCTFCITARDKDCTFELLNHFGLDFHSRGKGRDVFLGKMFYLAGADFRLWKLARSFRPDLFLSFGSPYGAQVSFLMRKPHIAFDDTEHARLEHLMYGPFTDVILTPANFGKDFGKKHIRFNGMMELSYLHPAWFQPDISIYDHLKISPDTRYVIMRFISWEAGHDRGHFGISDKVKMKTVEKFSKHARVFISSEGELPEPFRKFKLELPAALMHHALYYSSLYFGESGTMATEAAILGTPSVRVSSLAKLLGNFKELHETYGIVDFFDSDEKGYRRALELLEDENSKQEWKNKAGIFVNDKIDVTNFIVDFVTKRFKNG